MVSCPAMRLPQKVQPLESLDVPINETHQRLFLHFEGVLEMLVLLWLLSHSKHSVIAQYGLSVGCPRL